MSLCLVLSCGIPRQALQATPNEDELVEYIWSFKDSHPEGFTLSLITLTEPKEGISVAYETYVTPSDSKEYLKAIIAYAMSHDGYIGGWLDSRDSTYCFDAVKIFPEDRMDEAKQFAIDNNQAAYYVLSTSEEIWVEKKDQEEK